MVGIRTYLLLGAACMATTANAQSMLMADAQAGATARGEEPPAETGSDIIVTAQRRAERARDVPISITAFTGADIEQNNIRNIDDYARRTPNISFTRDIGTRQAATIGIRGVSNLGGLSNAFTIYLDEFAGDAINPGIYDVERVEVLRGPQGTYFGRNSTGGALNITSRKPDQTLSAEGEFGAARFNTFTGRGFINLPLSDTLAVRATGEYESSDGPVHNVFPGGVQGNIRNASARLQARWRPVDALTVDLEGMYEGERSGLLQAVPTGVVDEFTNTLLGFLPLIAIKSQLTGLPNPFAGLTPASLPVNDAGGFYPRNQGRVSVNGAERATNQRYTFIGKIGYGFGRVALNSITGYQEIRGNFDRDIDGTHYDYSFATGHDVTTLFTQELRLSSTGSGPFQWTVGGYYLNRKNSSVTTTDITAQGQPFFGSPIFSVQGSATKTESAAGFVDTSYKLTPRLKLTAGVRYTNETISNSATDQELNLDILNTQAGFAQFLAQGFTLQPQVTLPAASSNFSNWSPRVALNYQLTTDIEAYGVISRGFKSGGPQTNVAAIAAGLKSFAPETLTNYELGLKGRLFGGAVDFTLAGFWMTWRNLQVSVERPTASGSFVIIDNAASAHSRGTELEVGWRTPLKGLRIDGGIGYLDARFRRFTNADFDARANATCRAFLGQPLAADGSAPSCDLSGQRLPLAPKWTVSGSAEYRTELGQDTQGYLRAEYQYRSSSYANLQSFALGGGAGVFPYQIAAFDVTNIRVGMDRGKFGLNLFVENVFNKRYFTVARPAGYFNGLRVVPNPVNYGVRAKITF